LGDAGPLVILAVLSVFGGFVDMAIASNIFWLRYSNRERTSSRRNFRRWEKHRVFADGHFHQCGRLGWLLAWLLYSRRPQLPARIAASLGGLYQRWFTSTTSMKSTCRFRQTVIEGSTTILWHGVDQDVIDATVNNSATAAREVSDAARQMQSAICDPMRGGWPLAAQSSSPTWSGWESRINMESFNPIILSLVTFIPAAVGC